MATEDEPAPIKKPRSEAQVQSLNKARAKARELRTKRNMFREKHNISDDTDATPIDETDDAENDSDSASENEDEEPKPAAAAVVEKKPKVEKEKLIKPKTDPAPKPKRQATPYYQPQQKMEHVPVPNQFRMMSRHNYILFDE